MKSIEVWVVPTIHYLHAYTLCLAYKEHLQMLAVQASATVVPTAHSLSVKNHSLLLPGLLPPASRIKKAVKPSILLFLGIGFFAKTHIGV